MTGLSTAQVAQSRAQYGANILTPPKRDPWRKELLSKFENSVIRTPIIVATIWFGVGASALKTSRADEGGAFVSHQQHMWDGDAPLSGQESVTNYGIVREK